MRFQIGRDYFWIHFRPIRGPTVNLYLHRGASTCQRNCKKKSYSLCSYPRKPFNQLTDKYMNTYLCSRLHNPLHMFQHWCLRYCYILQLCSTFHFGTHCLDRHRSRISTLDISNNGIAAFCAHQNELHHSEFITLLCYEFWVMEVVPRLFWWAQNNAIPSFEIPSTH